MRRPLTRYTAMAALCVLTGLSTGPSALADESPATGIADAIPGGTTHLNFRYRFEYVDEADFSEHASASTLRFRLNYGTRSWRNWSGFAEFDYVGHLLFKDFNSGGGTSSPDRNQYPVVADPSGADLNQFYLDYNGFTDTRLRFGRQRILLDNQRFVGGVGWRQNEQTYDGVSVNFKGLPRTELFYSYIASVNSIFGDRSSAGRRDLNSHLLNAGIQLNDRWKVTPFYYYIDDDDLPAFSTGTLGARVSGSFKAGDTALSLLGEVATQTDVASNPVSYRAGYFHLDANWTVTNHLTLGLGLESLGGHQTDAGQAFRTPLATLHAFQGWADQFLGTASSAPAQGVEDLYFSAQFSLNQWTLQAIYHDFSAAAGPLNWGDEIDLAVSRKLGDRYSLLLKGAFFNADDVAFDDASKIWVQVSADF